MDPNNSKAPLFLSSFWGIAARCVRDEDHIALCIIDGAEQSAPDCPREHFHTAIQYSPTRGIPDVQVQTFKLFFGLQARKKSIGEGSAEIAGEPASSDTEI